MKTFCYLKQGMGRENCFLSRTQRTLINCVVSVVLFLMNYTRSLVSVSWLVRHLRGPQCCQINFAKDPSLVYALDNCKDHLQRVGWSSSLALYPLLVSPIEKLQKRRGLYIYGGLPSLTWQSPRLRLIIFLGDCVMRYISRPKFETRCPKHFMLAVTESTVTGQWRFFFICSRLRWRFSETTREVVFWHKLAKDGKMGAVERQRPLEISKIESVVSVTRLARFFERKDAQPRVGPFGVQTGNKMPCFYF